MHTHIAREITPLSQNDCFSIFIKEKNTIEHAVHFHDEFELNLILNAKGAKRMVSNHIGFLDTYELVLIGPNVNHGWYNHNCINKPITEITIQFHKDTLSEQLLMKNDMQKIREMFKSSNRGILFSQETAAQIKPRILAFSQKKDFTSVLEFLCILNDLSKAKGSNILSNGMLTSVQQNTDNSHLNKLICFLEKNHYRKITLADAATAICLSEQNLGKLIKTALGHSFTETLSEIRINAASKMLIETTHTVAEIAYQCGFSNLSHFYRVFRKMMLYAPTVFRELYSTDKLFA